jgi:transposase-like protein
MAKLALEALKGDQTLVELAARHQVHPNLIPKWKRQAGEDLTGIFSGKQPGC